MKIPKEAALRFLKIILARKPPQATDAEFIILESLKCD